jgi:hypothetical protein
MKIEWNYIYHLDIFVIYVLINKQNLISGIWSTNNHCTCQW